MMNKDWVYKCALLLMGCKMAVAWISCELQTGKTIMKNQTFQYINESALTNCTAGITHLTVSENDIAELVNETFQKLAGHIHACAFYQLQTIDLTNNFIRNIESGTFHCVISVKTLILSYNDLTYLPAGIFDSLTYLSSLDISYNSIRHIHKETFTGNKLRYLTHVYLQQNELTSFEPWAYALPGIKFFDLRNNSISTFSNEIGWKYDLEDPYSTRVDLRDNQLTHWRDEFLLQYNQGGDVGLDFVTYNIDVRDNPWMCDCHLHYIVKRFQSTFYAHVKDELVTIECQSPYQLQNQQMFFVRRLKELVCNITTDCPDNCLCQWQPENNIMIVNCSHATLTSFPHKLPALNHTGAEYVLDFRHNQIKKLSKETYTQSVQTLYIQGNGLTEIESSAMSDSKALTFLDIHDNQLSSIPSSIQRIPFETVDLKENPFICDCNMTWMPGWLGLSPVDTPGRSVTCTHEQETEYKILDVTDSLLSCTYELAILLAVGFGVLLILVIIVVVWTKRCPYETKVLLSLFCGMHPSDRYKIDDEPNTEYDVYLSFDDGNVHIRQWVRKLARKLEGKKPFYRLYIPIRDHPTGEDRADVTIAKIEKSKRIIVILSDNYDNNEWCQFEYQRAEILQLQEGRIIFIKFHVTDEMTEIIQTEPWNSRIKDRKLLSPYEDKRWFWAKLRYELPPIKSSTGERLFDDIV